MEQFALSLAPSHRVYSVTELNASIRATLDAEFQDVRVTGEISGVRLATSGHCYFTLKERDSQVKCACFRSSYRYLKIKPQEGMAVVARGRIDVFEQRGEYQLLVESLEPQGQGALQFAFEELKKKLKQEGLFETARKRPLPKFPRRIGVVTSPRGAVISDILHVLERRFPGLHIRLFPALVQGEGSVEDVCRGLEYFAAHPWADVVIVARGGGSLEDLWSFNSEAVARAIAASPIPVISAVGHETDVTIADFVADLRAPTPSAAAEVLCCTRQELLDRIAGSAQTLTQVMRYRLVMSSQRLQKQGIERATTTLHRGIGRQLQSVDDKMFRLREQIRITLETRGKHCRKLQERLQYFDLRPRLARDRNRWEAVHAKLEHLLPLQFARRQQRLATANANLEQLSPLRILDRGYAIVTRSGGEILKDAAAVSTGSTIAVRLAAGRLQAEVTGTQQA